MEQYLWPLAFCRRSAEVTRAPDQPPASTLRRPASKSNDGPDALDDHEGPRAGKCRVQGGGSAADREDEDPGRRSGLKRIRYQHDRDDGSAEDCNVPEHGEAIMMAGPYDAKESGNTGGRFHSERELERR